MAKWFVFRVSHYRGDSITIEAPSLGVAIEYYMATHGIMSSDQPCNVELLGDVELLGGLVVDEPREQVLGILPLAEEQADEMDRWYGFSA